MGIFLRIDTSFTSIIRVLLRKYFCKVPSFWHDGYFVCSIGEANLDTIRKYIKAKVDAIHPIN